MLVAIINFVPPTLPAREAFNYMPTGIYKRTNEIKLKMSLAKKGNKYGKGNKGGHISEKQKRQISEAMKGRKLSEETKKKMSLAHKGHPAWNKGMKGHKLSEETKRKISLSRKGMKLSEKTRRKMSLAKKGWKMSEEQKKKNKLINLGRHRTEEFKRKNSEAHKREKSSLWQGGKSFEPYGLEFNKDLKEVIRNRDRRKCFICEKTELENKEKLSIHHIDYNKKNNDPKNLISLCRICHRKTNFNRNYWINYFLKKN